MASQALHGHLLQVKFRCWLFQTVVNTVDYSKLDTRETSTIYNGKNKIRWCLVELGCVDWDLDCNYEWTQIWTRSGGLVLELDTNSYILDSNPHQPKLVALDFHGIFFILWNPMDTSNCNILQKFLFCILKRKETHTGLEQHRSVSDNRILIFGWNYPLRTWQGGLRPNNTNIWQLLI